MCANAVAQLSLPIEETTRRWHALRLYEQDRLIPAFKAMRKTMMKLWEFGIDLFANKDCAAVLAGLHEKKAGNCRDDSAVHTLHFAHNRSLAGE